MTNHRRKGTSLQEREDGISSSSISSFSCVVVVVVVGLSVTRTNGTPTNFHGEQNPAVNAIGSDLSLLCWLWI